MKISNSEFQIMSVLWTEAPQTVGQIIGRVQKDSKWHPNTIKTMLIRLVQKGAVTREKDGKRYFYKPMLTRGNYVSAESDDFLDFLFSGRMGPLVAHFAERKKLSKQDIDEIEKILNLIKTEND
ncbi:MAG: BlaI/MecI/CopY family transcriptional regulator [SAR86 cluster bacterium]|uniref:BlaI/MecI/CopY family transcriptional regulator n=1 Tax=SAR86 cluster bacterium TaxID=2030880 RepID=A0A2A4WYT4_9GAMM|nr:MAG: BlaI/MecI/CopY family transcriptional regulator [SAR86 cluster bacterium]